MITYTPSIFQTIGTPVRLDTTIISIQSGVGDNLQIASSIVENGSTNASIIWLWVFTLALFCSGLFFFVSETIKHAKHQRNKLSSQSDKSALVKLSQKRLSHAHKAA